MPAKRKAPARKKAPTKKTPTRKTPTRKAKTKAPTIAVQGNIPKLKLTMPLDDKKIAAIQRCLAKGQLTITVSRVDLAAGRLGEAWLYD